jgi:hypothetical protein
VYATEPRPQLSETHHRVITNLTVALPHLDLLELGGDVPPPLQARLTRVAALLEEAADELKAGQGEALRAA